MVILTLVMWASSISTLHPCIEQQFHVSWLSDPLSFTLVVIGLGRKAPILYHVMSISVFTLFEANY